MAVLSELLRHGGTPLPADTPLTAEDLAAALTAFAISVVSATMSPKNQTPHEVLEHLANEIDDLAKRAPGTPAAEALELTARMLMASEPR